MGTALPGTSPAPFRPPHTRNRHHLGRMLPVFVTVAPAAEPISVTVAIFVGCGWFR